MSGHGPTLAVIIMVVLVTALVVLIMRDPKP